MKARVWTRRDTQGFLRRLRKQGFRVIKKDGGYEARDGAGIEGKKVFIAMPWNAKNYLIRHDFEEETAS